MKKFINRPELVHWVGLTGICVGRLTRYQIGHERMLSPGESAGGQMSVMRARPKPAPTPPLTGRGLASTLHA